MGKSPTILSVLREGPGDAGAFRNAPIAGDRGRAGSGKGTAQAAAAGGKGASTGAGLASAMVDLKLGPVTAAAPATAEELFVEEGDEEDDEDEADEEDDEDDGMGGGVFDIHT